jgi:hypothetical protein
MTDSGFEPFWDGAAVGQLRFPHCTNCERFHWYPMTHCPHCGVAKTDWLTIDPEARVYSWTVVHRPFEESFAAAVPYVVALLEFPAAPGVRLITNLTGIGSDDVEFGLPATPAFDLYDGAKSRLMFRA